MKALITGASSGMGKDMAKVLSEKGYELILVARDEQKLEEAAKEIGKNTQIIVADLSDVETCKKTYEQASDIDLLINNAGFGDCGQLFARTTNEYILCNKGICSTSIRRN